MPRTAIVLPLDARARLGAWLFIASLVVFFLSSILLYGLYAWSRIDDPVRSTPLPEKFLISTGCLLLISGLLHWATRLIRRDRFAKTGALLIVANIAAIVFVGMQVWSMYEMLDSTVGKHGSGRGVMGMVIVLAFLHALHVAGGIISLGVVGVRTLQGRYDHERHFAVDFAAQYWHFLDLVWLAMLFAFWLTTGGFRL